MSYDDERYIFLHQDISSNNACVLKLEYTSIYI